MLEAAGFRPIPVPEQADAGRPVPERDQDAQPRSAGVHGPGRAGGPRAQAPTSSSPPTRTPTGSAGWPARSPDGKGDFRFLTGNEIAALLTHFKLAQLAAHGSLPASPIVITTEVTTGQITRIARHFGAQVVNDLLVGFKYIADVLWQLEATGQYGDVTRHAGRLRDRHRGEPRHPGDAAHPRQGLGVRRAAAGRSWPWTRSGRGGRCVDYLDDLNRQFGYFRNELLNIVMTGLEGKPNMARMLDALRTNPPKEIGGLAVTAFEDLRDEDGRMGPFKGETDRAARNFLIFRLGGRRARRRRCACGRAAPSRRRRRTSR